MSAAPTISTSLTAECQSAMQSSYSIMATACGQPSGPSMTTIATNPTSFLASACSSACSDAMNAFASSANQTCGEQAVFSDQKETAHSLLSQFVLTSLVGCVTDNGGSYCAIGQLETLTANNLSPNSANLITNLFAYASKNSSFACSTCAKKQVSAIQGSTELDNAWAIQAQNVVSAQSLVCGSSTATTEYNSAVGVYTAGSLSFFAFLSVFFL